MNPRPIKTKLTGPLLTFKYAGLAVPVAYPNQRFDPNSAVRASFGTLYVDAVVQLNTTDDLTLEQDAPRLSGMLILTVVTDINKSDGAAYDVAADLKALYAAGSKFVVATPAYTITIMGHPHIREGMPDGGYWRTPVLVPFDAEPTAS